MGVVLLILKILLYIILAVLGIVVVLLIIPIGGEVSYIDGKLTYKAKASLINLMDSDGGGILKKLKKGKKKPKKEKKKKKSSNDEKPEKPNDSEAYPSDEADTDPQDIPLADEKPSDEKETEASVSDSGTDSDDKKSEKVSEPEEIEWKYDDEDDEAEEDDEADEEKNPLTEKLGKILNIWEIAERPALKLFKGFHFKDVYIDFIIADEDAYKCAISYGRMCAVIYNTLGQMGRLFDLRLKTVDIHPGFSLSKGRTDAALKLDFRLGTLVITGAWFLITYFFKIKLPKKLKQKKLDKTAAEQK